MIPALVAIVTAVTLGAVGACGKTEPASSLAPTRAPTAEEIVVSGDVIPPETLQLVTAIVPDWDARFVGIHTINHADRLTVVDFIRRYPRWRGASP